MFKRELLPPTALLMAFESAARHGSVSRAAQELHLTQSAISRQVGQLETRLGCALFHRVRQRVVLTDAGRVYAAELRQHFEALSAATQRVMTLGGGGEVLNLAVLPTFGTEWLIPRMPRFADAHPEVTVNFSTRSEPFDFEREPFDAAIHFGEDFWPGASCDFLLREDVVPVCSPALRDRHGLRRESDLDGVRLLHQSTRPEQWSEWFALGEVAAQQAMRGPRFEQFSMMAQAAASGLGVALVPRLLVSELLDSGRLVVLFDRALASSKAYYFVMPESRARDKLVLAFRRWLLEEAAAGAAGAVA
ncbi:transcriptional regulator GcvA [Xylophilus rhododendri]|uniref:Transcriptional regulator GcvA n=1 Tax=Xylophilus rhododendri TaxID=2697032 RepID=A0A857JFP0_9BURK|nr:LysR family transcriptional regulator [Xylophilus rhododendri]QHJ01486.1 transcriptional regulator GcvA [Xylophilus rhododendri]